MQKSKTAVYSTLLLGLLLFWIGCAPKDKRPWFTGNLHTHTTLSDGDTEPAEVIQWYKDHAYHFLSITDHNFVLDVSEYAGMQDENFVLISGNEISDSYDGTSVHVLALGLYDTAVKPMGGDSMLSTLQNNVNRIRQAGAVPVLAHPNFKWAFGAVELIGIRDCVLFEVLNAHPSVNNQGMEGKPSTEQMWDQALSAGKRIYGIGTDDMHLLASYPGKSWIMVKAEALTEAAILQSLEKGDFYVSTGVVLDRNSVTDASVKLKILAQESVRYSTMFLGEQGKILKQSHALNPAFKRRGSSSYVRVKIVDSNGKIALTQPVFWED